MSGICTTHGETRNTYEIQVEFFWILTKCCGRMSVFQKSMLSASSLHPEDGSSKVLRNDGIPLHHYMVSQPRRQIEFSKLPLWLSTTP